MLGMGMDMEEQEWKGERTMPMNGANLGDSSESAMIATSVLLRY